MEREAKRSREKDKEGKRRTRKEKQGDGRIEPKMAGWQDQERTGRRVGNIEREREKKY